MFLLLWSAASFGSRTWPKDAASGLLCKSPWGRLRDPFCRAGCPTDVNGHLHPWPEGGRSESLAGDLGGLLGPRQRAQHPTPAEQPSPAGGTAGGLSSYGFQHLPRAEPLTVFQSLCTWLKHNLPSAYGAEKLLEAWINGEAGCVCYRVEELCCRREKSFC